MKVQQISIFLENRAGRLDTVAELLGKAGINIRALSLADTSDFGILRLIVNKPAEAETLLKDNNFAYCLTEVIAVEVPDVPGGLARVLTSLADSGINVEYMYAFVEKAKDKAVLVFRFDNLDKAMEVLSRTGFHILTGEEIFAL